MFVLVQTRHCDFTYVIRQTVGIPKPQIREQDLSSDKNCYTDKKICYLKQCASLLFTHDIAYNKPQFKMAANHVF